MCLPMLMDPAQLYEPFITSSLTAWGMFLDPFVALINQSCAPNTWASYESNELRVRALRDIPAGTELMFTYMNGGGVPDYKPRQKHLFKTRNIKCKCSLCEGHLGPTGELLERVNKHEDLGIIYVCDLKGNPIKAVEQAIADMKTSGFGFETRGMRALHENAAFCHLRENHVANALKLYLAIYYQIEPSQYPPTPLYRRIDTLFSIISLLDKRPSCFNYRDRALAQGC